MNKKVDKEYKDIKDAYILQCICSELKSKLQQKENIIKEVREKIKNHLYAKTILSDFYSDKEIFEFILEKTGDTDEQR